MKSKNELKKINMKNRTCHYFDDIMRHIDIYSGDILLDEKLYKTYENNLIFNISYKAFMSSIPLHIGIDKIDGFIKIYDRIRCLVTLDGILLNHALTSTQLPAAHFNLYPAPSTSTQLISAST